MKKPAEVSVTIIIDDKPYSLITTLNPWVKLNEATIREAIDVVLKNGVSPAGGGRQGFVNSGLLLDPAVKKAMREYNEKEAA